MNLHENSAWFLLLLVLVPLIWWRHLSRAGRPTLLFSSVQPLTRPTGTWGVRARHIVPLLRTLAVVLLVVCLARPQKGNQQTRVCAEGVAIQMLVDRSGSMQAMDFHIDGRAVDRLTAVKKVATDFIFGTGDSPGRPDDLIGLIVFGTYVDSLCPLTLDHDHLAETLGGAQIAQRKDEWETAIGDAIALSVERLRTLEQRRDVDRTHKIKSKVVILLTDGENNVVEILPADAAKLAKDEGVRVHTIGISQPVRDFLGRVREPDFRELEAVASETGGRISYRYQPPQSEHAAHRSPQAEGHSPARDPGNAR